MFRILNILFRYMNIRRYKSPFGAFFIGYKQVPENMEIVGRVIKVIQVVLNSI